MGLPHGPSDLVQVSWGDRINTQDGVTSRRAPFGEPQVDVTNALERQEVQAVGLAFQIAACPDVEASA